MSTAVLSPPPVAKSDDLSPEELDWMNGPGREGRYEWVDGQPVKKSMSYEANNVGAKVIFQLMLYCDKHPIGDVLVEQEYQCFPTKPRQVRKPDISLVLHTRAPIPRPRGYLRFVPDLAVEVASPNDLTYKLDAKLEDYHGAKFPLVWVVNPESRLIRVYAIGQHVTELRSGDLLDAPGLLPGFAIGVDLVMPTI